MISLEIKAEIARTGSGKLYSGIPRPLMAKLIKDKAKEYGVSVGLLKILKDGGNMFSVSASIENVDYDKLASVMEKNGVELFDLLAKEKIVTLLRDLGVTVDFLMVKYVHNNF